MISIIIPSYRCSQSLVELHKRLVDVLIKLKQDYEIIMVNDASTENDWEVITQLASTDKKVIGIDLSRNFGQHYAITAGLENATGEWIVVMDGDLQDQPEEIEKLYLKAKQGYDTVFAQRIQRKDTFLKKLSSKLFYLIFEYLTDSKQDSSIANFGIFHRKVIKAVISMQDHIKAFPLMVRWVGFKQTAITVTHAKREYGKSSYSLIKMLRLATSTMLSFSAKPIYLTIKFGLFITFFAILAAIFYLYKYFTNQIEVLGFTSVVISIWFFSGTIITIIGVVSLYVAKIFEKTKDRPIYIIKDKVNCK